MSIVARLAATAVWAPLLLVVTCGAGRVALPITPAVSAATDIATAPDHRATVEGVAGIIAHDLGMPLPQKLTVFVYESRQEFRDGLTRDAGVNADKAGELALFAVGLARTNRAFLNARVSSTRPEWLRLIAHELTHVAQFELAGGEGLGEQWLTEGVAEHVAYQVLERIGVGALAERRALARNRVRGQAGFAHARLDLKTLGSPRGFTLRHQSEGIVETYDLAFLMADYLIERHGFPKVLEYFRLSGRFTRNTAFTRAFGQSVDEFERDVLAHLQQSVK